MKSRWITHKDKRIFLADYSDFGFDLEGLEKELNAATEVILQEPLDSVLSLSYVSGTRATPQALKSMQAVVDKNVPHVKRRAVVGITSVQRTMVDIVNKFAGKAQLNSFSDLEAAKDWLVEE